MIWPTSKYTGPERRRQQRFQPRPLRVILALLVIAGLGYGAAVLYLVSQETRLVFQAGRTLSASRPTFPYEQIDLPRTDGARQFAWIMPAPGASADSPWVLFLHGNAATIAAKVNIAHYTELRRLGLNVMAPEYRGFGGLEGIPTEAALEPYARRVSAELGPTLERSAFLQSIVKNESLMNQIAKRAARSEHLRDAFQNMIENEDARKQLRNPLFYLDVLMS